MTLKDTETKALTFFHRFDWVKVSVGVLIGIGIAHFFHL